MAVSRFYSSQSGNAARRVWISRRFVEARFYQAHATTDDAGANQCVEMSCLIMSPPYSPSRHCAPATRSQLRWSRPEAESVCKQMVGKKDVISGRAMLEVVAIERKLLAKADYGPVDFERGTP